MFAQEPIRRASAAPAFRLGCPLLVYSSASRLKSQGIPRKNGGKMSTKLPRNARMMIIGRARKLVNQGYSVIPIHGDLSSSEPKKPTMKWRAFQRRIADLSEMNAMFDSRAGGLAIVCGQVSQLLVIDFDDHLRYQRFCRQLPQFASSYTVKTKRGCHVYFRAGVRVPSHQFEGGDIKGEKSYVVAAPSVIAGFEYRALNGAPVKALDKNEVDAVLKYFHGSPGPGAARIGEVLVGRDEDIETMYEKMQSVIGRNNALYRCASAAMERGMSRAEIERVLLQRHVLAESAGVHKSESLADRYFEGRRTIASATSRRIGHDRGQVGIPNTVRERLLQAQKSSVTSRLLDVMVLSGWGVEAWFCMRDAIEAGKAFGLGRKSVMTALTGEHSSFNGRHIIARRYVEYLDIGGLNVVKVGRPVQLLFQMPSVSRLMNVLGVRWSPSDHIRKDDLVSGHCYRRALHREYVKRLSPQATMRFLANRVGVNERTVRRYNTQLGVHVCDRVGRFALTWETLKCLPRLERGQLKNQTPGYWLAIGEKSRFPAWRHIGAALLRRGGASVSVCARRASVFSLGQSNLGEVVYEAISAEMFMRLRLWREESVERPGGLFVRLRDALREVGARAREVRYEKLRLSYDSVSAHIAEDKFAETIRGYLVADDGAGGEVRRPARRGVAYRMLKQFGEGNVFLMLRDVYREVMAVLAGHAARVGDEGVGVGLLAWCMT